MAAIKELAGQTLWYGVSSIGAKFLNYLLTPILTYLMADTSGVRDYGGYSLLYSWIAVTNIIFTYGFETGYFRFSNKHNICRQLLFQTAFGSIIISTALFIIILSFFKVSINNFMNLEGHPEYILWCLCLIGLDALCTIPFAKLRQENRPKKYALIKLAGIIVNIIFTLFFLVWLPQNNKNNFNDSIIQWLNNQNRIGLLLIANILQNFIVFLMLFSEWKNFKFKIDIKLWIKLFKYSAPMIFIGLAGMINEVMDRQMLAKLLPANIDAQKVVGIYAANYKLAIFITLFIQAFKMAAEPFFFNQSREANAPIVYARVMKWFVIILSLAFLFSALYLDIWQYLIGAPYRSGLDIVPILLCANICLGIYYNLSVWYKLTDRMQMGLYITVFGTIITLVGNYIFIPHWGIYAAAWTTLLCYASMMILTYLIGQKIYFIPYQVKRIVLYLCMMLICFLLKMYFDHLSLSFSNNLQMLTRLPVATILFLSYILLIIKIERKELKEMPLIRKFVP
ncbi:polysaccharide biosynthesis protein [Sphingobacterium faecium NBRC 15299]|uniref:oligosaccharide flippase family protein n=1 Tax=Sphingobacterium faecium TaxID=34087 RepID=UPI000D388E0D|nr:oligosaccharide flippase family protein [Sphingobacterium faecium]PTX11768.1 O-antigen/teichoic acid export membrane protein [Sphingobacterium faecium]GEM63447.1 polysaccharide biosynthesis protein [Sphingobacterium faecium NBRC 15299]